MPHTETTRNDDMPSLADRETIIDMCDSHGFLHAFRNVISGYEVCNSNVGFTKIKEHMKFKSMY